MTAEVGCSVPDGAVEPFVGRASVLRRAYAWLAGHRWGLLAVTGAAGSGTSAVLRRLAEPSRDAPNGPATAAVRVDASGHTAGEVERLIAAGVGAGPQDHRLVRTAIAELHPTVLVDGLDELPPREVLPTALLLRDLAQAGFRLVVAVGTGTPTGAAGTPANVAGTAPGAAGTPAGTTAPASTALRVLAPTARIDLDEPGTVAEVHQGMVGLVCARAGSDPASAPPELIRLGQTVAYRAGGSFLVASLLASTVARDRRHAGDPDRLRTALGRVSSVADAVALDLSRLPAEVRSPVTRMLCVLAWAEGRGMPAEDTWPALATALTGTRCGEAEVRLTLDHAGWYVRTDHHGPRVRYRLRHPLLVAHFRHLSREHLPGGWS